MSRPLSILMLSDTYFPRVNGVSTSIQTFRSDLMELGHRVRLVVPAYGGAEGPEPDVVRIAGWPVPRDPEDRLMNWHGLRQMRRALADERWDIVHVHTPFLAHDAGVRLAREAGAPLVVTYHTLFEDYLEHYVPFAPLRAGRAFARRLSRHQCQQADAVIAPSRAIAERLRAYGVEAHRIRLLPTGLPEQIFDRGDGASFRQAHGIAPDCPVALYVGRLSPEKNIGFLLEALSVARQRVPGALLLVAGDGPAAVPLREEVRRLGIEDSVRFLGYVARGRSLADCYAAADVFAFASRTETQGLVLLEAMAQGLPVLALAEMGTREILDCPGTVIGRDTAVEFGGQLAELLGRPGLRRALASKARESAEAWRGRDLARRLVDIYQSLPARRPRGRRLNVGARRHSVALGTAGSAIARRVSSRRLRRRWAAYRISATRAWRTVPPWISRRK